jgi:hypothetical protein
LDSTDRTHETPNLYGLADSSITRSGAIFERGTG